MPMPWSGVPTPESSHDWPGRKWPGRLFPTIKITFREHGVKSAPRLRAEMITFTGGKKMSGTTDATHVQVRDNIGGDQIRSIVERVERLHAARADIASDIKDVFAEARSNGFDTKALQHVIKLRAQDPGKRQEFQTVVELYADALGVTL